VVWPKCNMHEAAHAALVSPKSYMHEAAPKNMIAHYIYTCQGLILAHSVHTVEKSEIMDEGSDSDVKCTLCGGAHDYRDCSKICSRCGNQGHRRINCTYLCSVCKERYCKCGSEDPKLRCTLCYGNHHAHYCQSFGKWLWLLLGRGGPWTFVRLAVFCLRDVVLFVLVSDLL
jgi:hypothetical protein